MKPLLRIIKQNLEHCSESFESGDVIVLQGYEANKIYFIEEGWAKVLKYSPDGREKIVDICGPGFNIGLPLLFHLQIFPVSAIAMTKITLTAFSKKSLEQYLMQYPHIMALVVAELGEKVLTIKELGIAAASEDSFLRVKYLIYHLAKVYGIQDQDGSKIPFQITQHTISQILGLSRPSISGCLKTLVETNEVILRDKYYIVPDNHLEKVL